MRSGVTTEVLVVILHVETETEEDVVPQKHLHSVGEARTDE